MRWIALSAAGSTLVGTGSVRDATDGEARAPGGVLVLDTATLDGSAGPRRRRASPDDTYVYATAGVPLRQNDLHGWGRGCCLLKVLDAKDGAMVGDEFASRSYLNLISRSRQTLGWLSLARSTPRVAMTV